MCNTCCNSCCNLAAGCSILFSAGGCNCCRCNRCGCNGCGCNRGGDGCGCNRSGCGCGCNGWGTSTANANGCGTANASGCGCGCTRRVAVPITGRIYLDLPLGAAQANATAANAGCGGGCMAYNASQASVSSGCRRVRCVLCPSVRVVSLQYEQRLWLRLRKLNFRLEKTTAERKVRRCFYGKKR